MKGEERRVQETTGEESICRDKKSRVQKSAVLERNGRKGEESI